MNDYELNFIVMNRPKAVGLTGTARQKQSALMERLLSEKK